MINKFKDFIGNTENLKVLQNKILSKTIPNAFLFYGPSGLGKKTLAYIFSASLNCMNRSDKDAEPCGICSNCKRIFTDTYPDVKLITREPDRASISIEQVREIKKQAYQTSYEGRYKVYIIDDSKDLKDASNALLKLIEEPPKETLFILLTDNLMKQLPTIISRCQVMKFQKLTESELKKFIQGNYPELLEEERLINLLSGGSPGEILKFSSEGVLCHAFV